MLTYCTNIHPGESWDDITGSVLPQVLRVKERLFPHAPFPVGLRLSARGAREAVEQGGERFRDRLERCGCFVPTLNGFPHGPFHGGPVKADVYLPDWRHRERVDYTRDLIALLRSWLPPGISGSISSVPICYGRTVEEQELARVRENILEILTELAHVAETGAHIVLALEPEPDCCLETAADVVRLVDRLALPPSLRPFLGVCYDCCHAAVVFEEPGPAFRLFREAEIPVPKIQVTAAPALTARHREGARLFCEPRYLHQTVVATGRANLRFADVTEALETVPEPEGEWRIHYHLPIHDGGNGLYGTSNRLIPRVLACRPPGSLLEIETYTHGILPEATAPGEVIDSICREFAWLERLL